jgi:hypothetical protein
MAEKKGKRKIKLQDLKPKKDAKGGVVGQNTTGRNTIGHNPPGHNPPTYHGP